jgi:hypothetical protein
MTPDERLTEVFDRGYRDGGKSLNSLDRDLFRIQDFILGYEMGGLSGYLYNRLPDLDEIRAAVAAMRKCHLPELAELLSEAVSLFREYVEPDPSSTWGEILKVYDPESRLDLIHRRIAELDNYGLAGSTIH